MIMVFSSDKTEGQSKAMVKAEDYTEENTRTHKDALTQCQEQRGEKQTCRKYVYFTVPKDSWETPVPYSQGLLWISYAVLFTALALQI